MHGPAFYVGNYPNKQIICCSYSDQMAKDFGREVRNIVDSEDFGMIFPGVSLASDSKSANRWNTNKGGTTWINDTPVGRSNISFSR